MAISSLSYLSSRFGLNERSEFLLPTKKSCFLGLSGKSVAVKRTGFKLSCSSNSSDHVENQNNKWRERRRKDYFREILCAQDLLDSLLNAGDRLVIVYFYSPACGACKMLYPKLNQIAEANQGVIFLKVNREVHRMLCKNYLVFVLPFFHFYRSAGRLCRFSCTLTTIKKFNDALEKHGNER